MDSFLHDFVLLDTFHTVLGFFVLWGLFPRLFSIKRAAVFWIIAFAANPLWGFMGGNTGGISGLIINAAKPFSVFWAIASIVTVWTGAPILIVRYAFYFLRWVYKKFKKTPPPEIAPDAHKERQFLTGDILPEESKTIPVDYDRRNFIAGSTVLAVSAATSGLGTYGALSSFKVQHEEVRLPGLPPALDGFQIGQISDPHVGDFIGVDELERAVDALNQAGVDLQVMTGDLVDRATDIKAAFNALERCSSRYGMLAVVGNHEKALFLDDILNEYQRRAATHRLRLLMDSNIVINHNGAPLRVVGVDFPMKEFSGSTLPLAELKVFMRSSAEKAFTGTLEGETVICLSHHPDFFPYAARWGADLTLAGHTHGGQVALFGTPLISFYDYMQGWYQTGNSHLFVSSGMGDWFPVRIGVPKVVTIITLRSAM